MSAEPAGSVSRTAKTRTVESQQASRDTSLLDEEGQEGSKAAAAQDDNGLDEPGSSSATPPDDEADTDGEVRGTAEQVRQENSHISELGGESALDPEAEQEVEATSVGGTVVEDQVSSMGHVPTVMNERVGWWIDYYTGRGRDRFQLHLDRADAFQPLIQTTLRQTGIADAVFYIALIESGFATRARSHAGAVGVWQFIRATGRRYGLTVARGIDERKDPIRSTVAAARYLGDLYNVFNDWYLAFAAYNCGEFRVMRAIVKGRTRDFWELSEKGLLPKETRHYVPKFLAAMAIAKNRQKYGFVTNPVTPHPQLKAVEVTPGTRLADVARTTGVDLAALASFNPHLLEKRAPKRGQSYSIWVPADAAEGLASSTLAAPLPASPLGAAALASDEAEDAVEFHRVAKGETLVSIAHEYGTSVRKLRDLNNIRSARAMLRIGQKIKVSGPKKTTAASSKATAVAGGRSSSATGDGDFVMYRVRSGDSLNKISRRFGVGLDRIKEANALARNHLFAGEVIRVPGGG